MEETDKFKMSLLYHTRGHILYIHFFIFLVFLLILIFPCYTGQYNHENICIALLFLLMLISLLQQNHENKNIAYVFFLIGNTTKKGKFETPMAKMHKDEAIYNSYEI